eukprot:s9914_g1.t1
MLLSIDVKCAHKSIKTASEDVGFAVFQLWCCFYIYLVNHFGASWSAYWWARLGALLLRISHFVLRHKHLGAIYVDDFLWLLPRKAFAPMAALLIALLQILGVPISWKKLRLGWKLASVGKCGAGEAPVLLTLAQPMLQTGSVWVRFNVWAGDTNLDRASISALHLLKGALTRHKVIWAGWKEYPNGAADAWAAKTSAGIGGWFVEGTGTVRWFHVPLTHDDLPKEWQCPKQLDKAISAFKLMAQHALLLAMSWPRDCESFVDAGIRQHGCGRSYCQGPVAEATAFFCVDEPVLLLPRAAVQGACFPLGGRAQ